MLLENCAMAVIRASRPIFNNSHDKLAFSLHATFISYGYLLTATGLSAIQDSAISSSSSSSSDEVSVDGWNSLNEEYAFVYHNPHNSEKYLIRCITMNEKLLIDVSRSFDHHQSDIIHLEIDTDEYVEEGDVDKSNYKDYFKNFPKLINSFKTQLFSKLSSNSTSTHDNLAANDSSSSHSDSPSSSTSTSDGMQVYQYPHANYQIPYPRVPVYHGPPVPLWHGQGADGNYNLLGPAVDPQWYLYDPLLVRPWFNGGRQHWQPRPQGGRGRGPRPVP